MYVTLCNAIIPFYDTQGANMTYTISENGTVETHPFTAKKFLDNLFSELCLDPKMLRHWSSRILHSKTQMPIIFMIDQVFIPVKIRTSIGKHDGCFGYILTAAITSYTDYEITLSNGQVLETLSSASYISAKLRDAKLLSYAYDEQKSSYDFMRFGT